jgi:thymidylate synthase (FAD)
LRKIELAGRTCYKSEDKISEVSYLDFIAGILKRGHESVIEHGVATAKIIADRGVTHELVRHRIASYSQESTRYCNYSLGKFGHEITVIEPPGLTTRGYNAWRRAMESAEQEYFEMLDAGEKPQIDRSVLPTCLKAEIWVTCNFREWRHIFRLRTSEAAHPQIRHVMVMGRRKMAELMPVLFAEVQ